MSLLSLLSSPSLALYLSLLLIPSFYPLLYLPLYLLYHPYYSHLYLVIQAIYSEQEYYSMPYTPRWPITGVAAPF
jgi:hypothetical protein